MKVLDTKTRILDSLNEMDKTQADKVLEYIHQMLMSPRERVDYKRFRESALQQINNALRES